MKRKAKLLDRKQQRRRILAKLAVFWERHPNHSLFQIWALALTKSHAWRQSDEETEQQLDLLCEEQAIKPPVLKEYEWKQCSYCNKALKALKGSSRSTCSETCRQMAYRVRKSSNSKSIGE